MKALIACATLTLLVGYPCAATELNGNDCAMIERKLFESFFFGRGLRPQHVYSNNELIGWRVYEPKNQKILVELGLRPGDLIRHFCGTPIPEILNGDGKICCRSRVNDSVDLTVERNGQTFKLRSPMPGRFPLQATKL
jgi:hypothetical protein